MYWDLSEIGDHWVDNRFIRNLTQDHNFQSYARCSFATQSLRCCRSIQAQSLSLGTSKGAFLLNMRKRLSNYHNSDSVPRGFGRLWYASYHHLMSSAVENPFWPPPRFRVFISTVQVYSILELERVSYIAFILCRTLVPQWYKIKHRFWYRILTWSRASVNIDVTTYQCSRL